MNEKIVLKGVIVPYELQWKRVQNINIRIRDGRVLVSAPFFVPKESIEQALQKHADKILTSLHPQKQPHSVPQRKSSYFEKEQLSFSYQGEEIPYIVEWKNIKNVHMRVLDDKMIHVSAPTSMSVSKLEQILQQYAESLKKSLEKIDARQQFPTEWKSGEEILYLGEYYTLELRQSIEKSVIIENQKILVSVPDPQDAKKVRQYFMNWWYIALEELISNLLHEKFYPYYAEYIQELTRVDLKHMVSEWGNCYAVQRRLTFNERLLAAPIECVEYVVLHELTHFIHQNHSKAFWTEVEKYMPDWKKRRDLLNKHVKTRV